MARQTPDPEFILRGSDGPVTSLCFMHGTAGKQGLLSGTQNGTVTAWNLLLRRPEHSFQAHPQESVLWLQTSGEDKEVLSHGRGGSVCRWQCQDNSWHRPDTFPAASLGFCAGCTFTYEDKSVLAVPGCSQSSVEVVSMDTKDTLFTLAPPGDRGMSMHMTSTEIDMKPYLLIAYENGSIILWDLKQQTMSSELQAHTDSVMSFDYCDKLNKGVSGSVDEGLCVWNITPDLTLAKVKDVEITNPGVNCVKFRQDGKVLATGGWDGQVRLFSGKKQTPLAVLGYHKDSITSLTFAEDNTLAVGSKDTTISVWNIYK